MVWYSHLLKNFPQLVVIHTVKGFDFVWITKNWKILQGMGIPDHLTCLLQNLYAGQEATIKIGHRTAHCFQIGKGVHRG